MDLGINIVGLKKVGKGLSDLPKQIRFATAVALTRTAKDVHAELGHEMRRVFERPTPFTLKSHFWVSAKAKDLDNQSSRVGIKDFAGKGTPAEKYLRAQVFGGERDQKRFEKWMGGASGGRNLYLVPGPGAKLDSFGNVRRGVYVKVMSALKTHPDPLAHRTATSRKRNKRLQEFFIGEPRGVGRSKGIYERKRKKISLLFIFATKPRYKKRYKFYEVGEKKADKVYDDHFKREYRKALISAFK